jgi:hypothetical protein
VPDLRRETEAGNGGRVLLHAPILVSDDEAGTVTPGHINMQFQTRQICRYFIRRFFFGPCAYVDCRMQ